MRWGEESERWKHDWYASALRAKGETSGEFDGDGVEEERYELNANRYELGAASALKFTGRDDHVVGAGRHGNDDFSPYESQAAVSVGYGRSFIKNERTRFSGGVGPGYRRARSADTCQIESGAIARGKLDFSHLLTANTQLVDTLLVEADSDNTFAQNDLGVAVAMNEAFAPKAGLQARHNTKVDAGARKTDTLTTINLVYSFR